MGLRYCKGRDLVVVSSSPAPGPRLHGLDLAVLSNYGNHYNYVSKFGKLNEYLRFDKNQVLQKRKQKTHLVTRVYPRRFPYFAAPISSKSES